MTEQLPARFINYRVEWDATKQKFNKIPCNADGVNINHLDPSQWMDHTTAAAQAHWDTQQTGAYGVAFVLNGDGWWCLDLDNCRRGDGWTSDANLTFLSFGGALGEVSMSGTGLHVFGRCDPEQLKDRRNKWEGDKEFYMDGRFIALSEAGPQPIGGTYRDTDWTQQLLKLVPQREFLGDLPEGRADNYTGPDDDDELIAMMLASTGGAAAAFNMKATVGELWTADPVVLGKHYPPYHDGQPYDASSADAALMSHLAFWTGRNMPRMERLFRRSGLMREKWESRPDYRRSTTEKAARLCKRVYDRPKKSDMMNTAAMQTMPGLDATEGVAAHSGLLRIPQQIEFFKGCTYVADVHKVLMPNGDLYTPERFNSWMGGYSFVTNPDAKPTKKAFEAFTENQMHQFPKARTTTFRPDMEPGLILPDQSVNVWVPAVITRRAGDISMFMDFMSRMFPAGMDGQIVIDWMRDVVQNPGKKAMWALVVQGTEGNGKSMIGEILSQAVGLRYIHKPKASRFTDKFDSWMLYKLLAIADEFYAGKDRFEVLEILKPLITDYYLPTRGMQAAENMVWVPINWYLTTNHQDAVRKNKQDRRYCVHFTPHQTAEQRDAAFEPGVYFPQMWDWLRGGGFEALNEWLWTSKAERFGPYSQMQTTAPDTTTTKQVMDITRDPIQAEIIEAVDSGMLGFQGGWVSSWALTNLLEQKHYRIPPTRRKQILEEMGYVTHGDHDGRSGRVIPQENNSRPILWCLPELKNMPLETYTRSQGY